MKVYTNDFGMFYIFEDNGKVVFDTREGMENYLYEQYDLFWNLTVANLEAGNREIANAYKEIRNEYRKAWEDFKKGVN